jgi:hypothetical protein
MELTPGQKQLLIALRDQGLALRTPEEGLYVTKGDEIAHAYRLHQMKLAFVIKEYAWITFEGLKWLSRHE